jgi:hypothetical protein
VAARNWRIEHARKNSRFVGDPSVVSALIGLLAAVVGLAAAMVQVLTVVLPYLLYSWGEVTGLPR